MSTPDAEEYLRGEFAAHGHLAFRPGLVDRALRSVRIVSLDEALHTREPVIVVPSDVVPPRSPGPTHRVPFNGTALTIWNRLPVPGSGWRAVPGDLAPLWYVHESGTVMPAWNLFRNVFDALTFQEEREISKRDRHGRFESANAARAGYGLLRVPVFNEALAALVGAWLGLADRAPRLELGAQILSPPIVVLSHDCDLLRGNDRWTQAIRAFRVAKRPWRAPKLRWMLANALRPRAYYLDQIPRMIAIEEELGFRSTFYLLNGTPGRFGARSGSAIVEDAIRAIPGEWEIGVHYNYDTFLDAARFEEQLNELRAMGAPALTAGRAHYLRFDAAQSPQFLRGHGIRFDESAGFYDRVGYRAGIAGCFHPMRADGSGPLDLLELPLMFMESTLWAEAGAGAVALFAEMLAHVAAVGGAVSVLFHPDIFCNPEFPEYIDGYRAMLAEARRLGARSRLPRDLLADDVNGALPGDKQPSSATVLC